ncbi:MAG: hypothetical protein R3E39_16940 [Anaerolineae bacterium]
MLKICAALLILIVAAACSPAAESTQAPLPTIAQLEAQPTATQEIASPSQTLPTPTPESIAQSASLPTPTAEGIANDQQGTTNVYTGPAWANLPLVDARSGATFTFADFAGKTVLVEPMSISCTDCVAQIARVEAARAQLDPNQYVFVGLSVGETVDNATLAQFVSNQGWNFTFAVATAELTSGLVSNFGRTVVTPSNMPYFIIRPDGSFVDIKVGTPTTEELVAQLQTASSGA